jgi:hypothetical protein
MRRRQLLVALALGLTGTAGAGEPQEATEESTSAAEETPAQEAAEQDKPAEVRVGLVERRLVGGNVIEETYAVPTREEIEAYEQALETTEVPAGEPSVAPIEAPAGPLIVLTPVEQLADLAVTKRVIPEYPSQLEVVYGERAIRCTSRVWVDHRGMPIRVAMVDCPKGFHLTALTAMTKWRWERSEEAEVPPEGLQVEASVGFMRRHRTYYPGVAWLDAPEQVTADPNQSALLRSGTLPAYPEQVSHGDAVCLIELTVSRKGTTEDLVIDECAQPYRIEAAKAVRKWRWYPAMRGDEAVDTTVVTTIAFRLASSIQLDAE